MKKGRPWFKFYDPGVPEEIEVPDIPLHRFLFDSAEEFPNKTAFVFFHRSYTYGYLLDKSLRFAGFLRDIGLKKQEALALFLPNTPQFLISYYGTLSSGGICVQINPMLVEREIRHILFDSGAKGIVLLDILFPKISHILEDLPLEFIIVTRLQDYLPFPLNIFFSLKTRLKGERAKFPKSRKIYLWRDIINTAPLKETIPVDPKEDVACLQYTGGTTGLPKGAVLTHYNLVANTLQATEWLTDTKRADETVLGVLPFFHVYGMTVSLNFSVSQALTLIVVPKFHIKEVLSLIQRYKISIFPGVPLMYQAIVSYRKVDKYDLSSVRVCISGAAPLSYRVKERFESMTGARLVEGYGLSEASPVTHCNPIYGLNKPGSIGIPFPSTSAKIVDIERGEMELEPGKAGELVVKGPQVMKGYWNKDEETARILRDGWLYTGDIARMDEDGYFYIIDRKKDMIIVKGFNVYPKEVEDILLSHPAVKDAACIGVPSEETGEAVKAYIVPKENTEVSEDSIIEFCKENLAGYKVPSEIEFVSKIPRSFIGKLLRRVLRESIDNEPE